MILVRDIKIETCIFYNLDFYTVLGTGPNDDSFIASFGRPSAPVQPRSRHPRTFPAKNKRSIEISLLRHVLSCHAMFDSPLLVLQ
jgi:hypothetical protein